MSYIFISHSSRDAQQAADLLTWLHSKGFTETFLDFDKHVGIAPGANWEHTLYREMTRAEAVVLILTKNWLESKWCFAEFIQARVLGKPIFPLIEAPVGGVLVSPDIQHLDLVSDREGCLDQLATRLSEITLTSRRGFSWDGTRPPYPGLLAFDEADAAIYFGRDDSVRHLVERLNARRALGGAKLVAVLGASGSGKSSLLRAGVLPGIKRDKRNWIVLPPFRPQLHPLEELAQVIAITLGPPLDWRHWRDVFAGASFTAALSDLARDLRSARDANEAQILITVDQAEELFSTAEQKETEQFFCVINGMLDERLPFFVTLALRSDYLSQFQASSLTVTSEDYILRPLPLAEVRDIIEGPALVAGISVDEALVSAIIKDASTDDALPLLAFVLRELYDRFGDTSHLTLAAYTALGNMTEHLSPLENAVRHRADEVLANAKPTHEELQALRSAFIPSMVRVYADDGEYVRQPARLDLLPAKAMRLIELLAKSRLLVINQDKETPTVEVAHEALLRKWPLVLAWLDEEREFLIGKNRLEQNLRDWDRAPADDRTEALLTGLNLNRARSWLIAKPLQLTEAERVYIQASIAQHELEKNRSIHARRRILLGVVAVAIMLAMVAGSAIWEWRNATTQRARAESRELAAESEEITATNNGDLGLVLQKAINAVERWPTEEAELALSEAVAHPLERAILYSGGPVLDAVFSHDGKRILTASNDHNARIWNAETGHLLVTLTGHTERIWHAKFSPNGESVATASRDKTARVWDTQSGRSRLVLSGHLDMVNDVAFSPDGERIATASADGTACVWDTNTGRLLFTLRGHTDSVYWVRFSPDGHRIVTASEDKTARVWDAKTGNLIAVLVGHTEGLNCASFSSDGKKILTASADNTARVWETSTGRPLGVLIGHTEAVTDAEFSPDGKLVVTSSEDRTAQVWDSVTSLKLFTLRGHAAPLWHAEFSPDGGRIITASDDHTARMWDLATGYEMAVLGGHTDSLITASFSPDGMHVLTASFDSTARDWDVNWGHPFVSLTGHSYPVFRAAFSPDSRQIVTASLDGTARIWDSDSGRTLAILTGHTAGIDTAVFSPDGKRIVTASMDKTARIWDVSSGQCLVVLDASARAVNDAEFSPDGKRIVTAGSHGETRVWDTQSGLQLKTLAGHTAIVYRAIFSPDGKRIVTASEDKTARIWDANSGLLLFTLSGHTDDVTVAVFSSDGNRIATGSEDHTARVWDAKTGHLLVALNDHSAEVKDISFSADGKRIVTAGNDNTARVWETNTGRLLATLGRHSGSVLSARFSPDGRQIVTASEDNTAQLWNSETGTLRAVFRGNFSEVLQATFSPDGKRVVTAGADGTARIYLTDLGEMLEWAKTLLPIESGK